MLNPFYWYSSIWAFVLILYSFGYSAINQTLSLNLISFLIITIILSIFLGYLTRNIFKYRTLKIKPRVKGKLTAITVILILVDLIYTRQIPFLTILKGHSQYGSDEVMGMPFIHTLLTNWILVYSSYLFYVYLETKSKKLLWYILLQLSFFVLFFQKGMIIIVLFVFFNLYIAKIRLDRRIFTLKNCILLIGAVLVLVYLNGGLANLRSGMLWNDSYYITTVARISNWPQWIPSQYIWAYTYITTPLGNLNQILNTSASSFDLTRLLISIIPALITNQFVDSSIVMNDLQSRLTVSYLNASTGFMDSGLAAGIIGIWLFYFAIVLIILFLGWYESKKSNFDTPVFALLSMMLAWCFFYDTFNAAATSLIPILILVFYRSKKRSVV